MKRYLPVLGCLVLLAAAVSYRPTREPAVADEPSPDHTQVIERLTERLAQLETLVAEYQAAVGEALTDTTPPADEQPVAMTEPEEQPAAEPVQQTTYSQPTYYYSNCANGQCSTTGYYRQTYNYQPRRRWRIFRRW